MRNFEERKAEIFLRSEKRIKLKKRKRRQLLAFCIPVCLLGIVSIALIPALPFVSDDAAYENNAPVSDDEVIADEDALTEEIHNFVTVKINGADEQNYTITESSAVDDIFEQICTILSPYDISDFSDGASSAADSNVLKDHTNGNKNSYIITLISSKDTKRTFTLYDNKLSDTALNIEIELTDNQLNELKTVLGLTD